MKQESLFENNFFFSKTLKKLDSNIGYKKENQTKLVKHLEELNKEKNKELIARNKKIKSELMHKKALKKEESKRKENSRNNVHQLNLLAFQYNFQYLPKISPFIHSCDNILIMDSGKAERKGSKGFEYIWKQENLLKISNIKKNENSRKTKSYNKANINNPNNKIKQNNFEKNLNNNMDDDFDDIFDVNYNEKKKSCEEFNQLKRRLNRIKSQNVKVNDKLEIYRKNLIKFSTRQIYHPKYESIDKHKPDINLDSKSKRIFPMNIMQKIYYKNVENKLDLSRNEEKEDLEKKPKGKTFYICSSITDKFNNLGNDLEKHIISRFNDINDFKQDCKNTFRSIWNTNTTIRNSNTNDNKLQGTSILFCNESLADIFKNLNIKKKKIKIADKDIKKLLKSKSQANFFKAKII